MLSVLIPTYNDPTNQLVSELIRQAEAGEFELEIRIYDDGSLKSTLSESLRQHPQVIFQKMETNQGRSAIRNQLAREAIYDWLLFLDADVLPNPNLILDYLPHCDQIPKVVVGGITYAQDCPSTAQSLRYQYGKKREAKGLEQRKQKPYLSFLSLNFLIHRSVFDQVTFNETLPNLRHEDTLFGQNLRTATIPIVHIDNTAEHLGLEKNVEFLKKSEEAVEALHFMINQHLLPLQVVKLSRIADRISIWGFASLIHKFYQINKAYLRKNLLGEKPSLLLFDLYRVGYWYELKEKANA